MNDYWILLHDDTWITFNSIQEATQYTADHQVTQSPWKHTLRNDANVYCAFVTGEDD